MLWKAKRELGGPGTPSVGWPRGREEMGRRRFHLNLSLTGRLVVATGLIITLTMAAGFCMEFSERRALALRELEERAWLVAQELVSIRHVIASRQDDINRDAEGRVEFKRLNPAAVGRLVAEHFSSETGYYLRQVRLEPRIAANAPDPVEAEMLRSLSTEPRVDFLWRVDTSSGEPLFRFMLPLWIEPECLQCHGGSPDEVDVAGFPKEGLRVGELGGAITVTASMLPFVQSMRRDLLHHLLLWAVLLLASWALIAVVVRRWVGQPLAAMVATAAAVEEGAWDRIHPVTAPAELSELSHRMATMAEAVRAARMDLERQVAERTAELTEAVRRLQELDKYRADFLASVSHELKTPLTAMLAYAELLRSEGGTSPEAEHQLTAVLEAGRLMESHLEDLLAAARMDAGGLTLQREPVDLTETARAAAAYLAPLAGRREVGVRVTGPQGRPAEPTWVLGDRRRLLQVVVNLLSNAIKFSPKGATVSVEVGSGAPKEVRLAVHDQGPGIDPERQALLLRRLAGEEGGGGAAAFVPGPQGSGGNGLGLSIAARLVRMHGGSLKLASEPGRGSTFTLHLPLPQRELDLLDDPEEEVDGP